jgi:hypothetical protein
MDSRNSGGPEPSRIGDSACVAGVGFVASDPQKLAQLPSLIKINRIAEIAQLPREIHPRRRLQTHSGMTSATKARELAMDTLRSGRTAAFVKHLAGIVDDANSRGLDANIETSP